MSRDGRAPVALPSLVRIDSGLAGPQRSFTADPAGPLRNWQATPMPGAMNLPETADTPRPRSPARLGLASNCPSRPVCTAAADVSRVRRTDAEFQHVEATSFEPLTTADTFVVET